MDDALALHAAAKLDATRSSPSAGCKVCGDVALPFDVVDFSKSCLKPPYINGMSVIPVIYRLCGRCQFIFTDFFDDFTPEQWRRYVYNDEYANVDPEYRYVRPRENANMLSSFLAGRKKSTIGLDYGGGNGMTADLLRKDGWNFDSFDPIDKTDMSLEHLGHYNFCSAIEVFEHTPDPKGTLREIIEKVNPGRLMVMISTVTSDAAVLSESRLNWWYAAPRNGHVSLYSIQSLQMLAADFGLTFTFLRSGPFFLTRGFTESAVHKFVLRGKLLRRLRRTLKITSANEMILVED